MNHVTGVSGFLQRQRMARRRRAEHDELVRTMGLPRHKASAATMSTLSGTTLTDPFTFQTAQRPRRRRTSCIPLDRVPHTTARAAKEKPCGVESPAWAHGLTSSARVLYDALTDSEEFPVTAAAAPFYPLPGYARSERSEMSSRTCPDLRCGRCTRRVVQRAETQLTIRSLSFPLSHPTRFQGGVLVHRLWQPRRNRAFWERRRR